MNEATRLFIERHKDTDPFKLVFQAKSYPEVDMAFAVQQIAGRQKVAQKLPSFYRCQDILYPTSLSLEQCSSEQTALYKASLVEGEKLVDLTGGFGVDCLFMSEKSSETHYVERNQLLLELAGHNFRQLGRKQIALHHQDAVEYLHRMSEAVDTVYIDPARRNKMGQKVFSLSDCEPDVALLADELVKKARRTIVKLSPMLDISLATAQLKYVCQTHVISVENECKELLFVLQRQQIESPTIYTVNFSKQGNQYFSFTRSQESDSVVGFSDTIKRYLYEPNAAILKAGGFKVVAERYGLLKLHPNTQLYTSDVLQRSFCGRIFQVTDMLPYQKKSIKEFAQHFPKVSIATRNFPLTANELRSRLKVAESDTHFLFGTTLANNQKILIVGTKVANNS